MAKYNAFISYSHSADDRLAPALQTGLQRLAKPWSKRRALEVFRDDTGLAVNPDLWGSITTALDGSEWFVLLASPQAAASKWVDQEVARWLERGPEARERILPVLTSGVMGWNGVENTFTSDTDAAPPALYAAFTSEPRHIDLTWIHEEQQLDLENPRFRQAVAEVAAPMHGVSQDELIGEDVRQHRRSVRIRRIAAAALITLTLGALAASVAAVFNAREADRQRVTAEENAAVSRSREFAARGLGVMETDPELAALLAVEARWPVADRPDSPYAATESETALRTTVSQLLTMSTYRVGTRISAQAAAIAISADGTMLATIDAGQPVELWDIASGQSVGAGDTSPVATPLDLAFSPDGTALVVVGEASAALLDVSTQTSTPLGESAGAAVWSADGSLVTGSLEGTVFVRSTPTSAPVRLTQVEGPVTALLSTPSGSLVVVDADSRPWIADPGGGLTPVVDRDEGDPDPVRAVWAADPVRDVLYRYSLDSGLDEAGNPFARYVVTEIPLASTPGERFAGRSSQLIAVLRGTLTASHDGAFVAAVDGEDQQGLPDLFGASLVAGPSVQIWNPATPFDPITIPTNEARDVAWLPNERVLAIASERGVEFRRVAREPVSLYTRAIAAAADWSRVVSLDATSGEASIYAAPFDGPVARFGGLSSLILEGDDGSPVLDDFTVRPDGGFAANTIERNDIQVVDLDSGEERLFTPPDGSRWSGSLQYSPAGDRLLVGVSAAFGDEGATPGFALLDADTGGVVLEVPVEGVDSFDMSGPVAWLPDGSGVFVTLPTVQGPSFRGPRELAVLTIATGELTRFRPQLLPTSLAVSDDGASLAVGLADGGLTIVDVASGTIDATASAHTSPVTAVDFSSDGTRVISAGGTIVISDISTGATVWTSDEVPAMREDNWLAAAYGPDGRSIAVGAWARVAFLSDADPAFACAMANADAFERLEQITEQASACERIPELAASSTVARGIAPARLPELVALEAADALPEPVPATVPDPEPIPDPGPDPDPEPEPTPVIADFVVPRFETTCPTLATNEALPLRQGDRGANVARSQSELLAYGFAIDADGCFGPGTFEAVTAYQRQNGLDVSGVVDAATWDTLNAARSDAELVLAFLDCLRANGVDLPPISSADLIADPSLVDFSDAADPAIQLAFPACLDLLAEN